MSARTVVFLSDFGLQDPFVGVCHAVMREREPNLPIVDLTHGVAPQDVRGGALALADSARYLPARAVVVAVVDPGVGGERRAVAVRAADGRIFVGPDNGLLWPALLACGGAVEAAELSGSPWRLKPTSSTFHARDVFCPVAARLAAGAALADAGQPLDPGALHVLELPTASVTAGELTAEALAVDGYGNVRLAAGAEDLERAGIGARRRVEIECGGLRTPAVVATAFADVPEREPLVYVDSAGAVAVAVNRGNAAAELGIRGGATVRILAA